jgi:probable HAF family extracellular repeat protein
VTRKLLTLFGALFLLSAFMGCFPEEEIDALLFSPNSTSPSGGVGSGDSGAGVSGDATDRPPRSDSHPPGTGGAQPAGPSDEPEADPPPSDEEEPEADWQVLYFDNDGHAGQGFDGCFTGEGRIGSAAGQRNHTFELDLRRDPGPPQNQSDFGWQNGGQHAFVFSWNGSAASFEVSGAVLQEEFECDQIDAVSLRCRANKGAIALFDLAIDGRGVPESVAAWSDPGNDLRIMRIEGDFGDEFTLTGTVEMLWDDEQPPRNSQLAFEITAGAVLGEHDCPALAADAGPNVTLHEVVPVVLSGFASRGTPPYAYSWSAPGWHGSSEQNPTVLAAETTTYTLTVTDQSDPPQTASDTVMVTLAPHYEELQYTIANLGSLSSNSSYPAGINDRGEVAGYYCTDSRAKRAFLYRDGAMADLGTLGGNEACARDINNSGQVVGEARNAEGDWRAFLWDSVNGMRDLGSLGGATSTAYAINESGQVVGYSQVGSAQHAFVYADGVMSDLGTRGYHQSGAFDLNDQAQVVGILMAESDEASAFIYDDGILTDLGSPLLSGSQAWVINDAGLLAGHSWGPGGDYRSFLYAAGTVVDLGTLDGFPKTYVYGINDSGQLVGSVTDATGTVSHAFVYTGGVLLDLNDLLVSGHGWEYLTAAYAVNSGGQIAGYGRINGQYRAFLLTPVP